MAEQRLFDLNIEKILEAWEDAHAVRELIANALDEQVLTGTAEVEINKDVSGAWLVRDYGRGLRYEHFTQNESKEKHANQGRVIGKFGVGLKDALATLHRSGVRVEIESAHGAITLAETAKHGFADVVTLHAAVGAPRDAGFVGTRIAMHGLDDEQMGRAKGFFMRFSDEEVLENTPIGQIIARKQGRPARIYVAGLLVAEEENFAFSYNITSLTAAMRKALNRERTNVGRTAYTDRVKQLLLQAESPEVAKLLAEQLRLFQIGSGCDEVRWKEVAVHAVRILSANGKYLFVSAYQLATNPNAIDHARDDGLEIVTIPDIILAEVKGLADLSGAPIRDLGQYQAEWDDSFSFDFVEPQSLNPNEQAVFAKSDEIAALAGGVPKHVSGIRVSRTMRQDFVTGADALGLWDPNTRSIVIRRDQLASLSSFAGTLLHEIVHAKTGRPDVDRDFECALTSVMGEAAAKAVSSRGAHSSQAPSAPLLKRLLGVTARR